MRFIDKLMGDCAIHICYILTRCKRGENICFGLLIRLLTCVSQVEKVITELNKNFPADGLLPIYINPDNGNPSYSTTTFGAMGDR